MCMIYLFNIHSIIQSLHFKLHLNCQSDNIMQQSPEKQCINEYDLCAQGRATDLEAWKA